MIYSVMEICELVAVREVHLSVDDVEAVDDDGGGDDGGSNEGPHQASEGSERLPKCAGGQWFARHHDRLFSTGNNS